MVTWHTECHFRPESSISEEIRLPATSAQLKPFSQTFPLSMGSGTVKKVSRHKLKDSVTLQAF